MLKLKYGYQLHKAGTAPFAGHFMIIEMILS